MSTNQAEAAISETMERQNECAQSVCLSMQIATDFDEQAKQIKPGESVMESTLSSKSHRQTHFFFFLFKSIFSEMSVGNFNYSPFRTSDIRNAFEVWSRFEAAEENRTIVTTFRSDDKVKEKKKADKEDKMINKKRKRERSVMLVLINWSVKPISGVIIIIIITKGKTVAGEKRQYMRNVDLSFQLNDVFDRYDQTHRERKENENVK